MARRTSKTKPPAPLQPALLSRLEGVGTDTNTAQGEITLNPSAGTFAVSRRFYRLILGGTLVVYAIFQWFWVAATPMQSMELPDNVPTSRATQPLHVGIGPDEKEHYLYVVSLASRAAIPRPLPRYRTSPDQYVSYQAQHPPLFYALAALIYTVSGATPSSDTIWLLLRGLCALLGAVTIVLIAQSLRETFPQTPFFSLAGAPLVAFMPMFDYMHGTLSNEPLALALGAGGWLMVVRLLKGTAKPTLRQGLILGAVLGLAALSRLTAVIWIPAALFGLWYAARQAKRNGLRPLVAFMAVYALLLIPWFLYNAVNYGTPFLRTFYRPTTEMNYAIVIFSVQFYISTSWYPYWLTQMYVPQGPTGPAHAVAVCWEVLLLLFLILHFRRSPANFLTESRVIVYVAVATLLLTIAAVVQQQLFVDWDVGLSGGRYLFAASPASFILLLLALAAPVWDQKVMAQRVWAAVLVALAISFDGIVLGWVQRNYHDNPAQPAVQRIENTEKPK